jgi:transcriptional regulator with XRE-family HTH domain
MTNIERATFGATLRNLRESKGLSLRKLARDAEISPTYLAQLERDENKPSDDVVFRLAAALDYDEDEMLALTGRIAEDLLAVIRKNPGPVAELLLEIQDFPPKEIAALTRKAEARRVKLGLE